MLDVITLVVVLVGAIYAISYVVVFLLKLVFKRKPTNWITQNYKQYSEVNLSRVNKVVASGVLPPEELSHWEMVAVFGLLLLEAEVPDVIQRAEVFGNQGWRKNFNYDFYEEISNMARKASAQGYKKNARKLIMFGLRLAELYNEKTWIEQYGKILDQQLAEQSDLEWEFTRGVKP